MENVDFLASLGVGEILRAIVARSAREFEETGDWVSFDTLTYEAADQDVSIDLNVVFTLPNAIGGVWSGEKVTLTGLGLVESGAAPRTVATMVRLTEICSERKQRLRDDAKIGRTTLVDEYGFDPRDAAWSCELVSLVPGLSGGGHLDGDWELSIGRNALLDYRHVHTVGDLQEVLRKQALDRIQAYQASLAIPSTFDAGHVLARDAAKPTRKEQVIELLREQVRAGRDGMPEDLTKWREQAHSALRIGLGQDHETVARFDKIRYSPIMFSASTPDQVFSDARRLGVRSAIAMLEGAITEIQMTEVDEIQLGVEVTMESTVFIVHGHDHSTKESVARTVQRVMGKEPVILHEQPNRGQTLIEKFERHAVETGYVVVIATGDDVGCAKCDEHRRPRARQNVVFEFGYFVGAIGRGKVAVLYEEGVELPSDLNGLVYIALDGHGAWKLQLAKELMAAGLAVDLTKL